MRDVSTGYKVLTAMVLKSSVFWDITPCSPVKGNVRFRRIILPVSSWSNCRPSRKPTEACGKLVMAVTTNIPIYRMARRLEGNAGKYVEVGSITAQQFWEGLVGIKPWEFF
jgi:hypothetical protein